MPSTHTDKDPQGNAIVFDEGPHTYATTLPEYRMDGPATIAYESVTTFVHRFVPAFDEDAVAAKVAARDGRDADAVKAEWHAKRDAACAFGTRVHETCEDRLLGRAPRNAPADDRERAVFRAAWDAAGKVLGAMRVWAVEKILFDIDLRLAGTADFIGVKPDGSFAVLDWKTNENIRKPSRDRMLAPVAHLAADSLSVYSLQLSMYEFIMRRRGYIPAGASVSRAVVHLRADGFEVIPLPDRAIEVRDMAIAKLLEIPL